MNHEAIIVLAGGINRDGTLSLTSQERTDAGIELFKNGDAPIILFSGSWSFMFPNPPDILESEGMKKYAISKGVPEENILTELKSKDTLGNAYFCKVDFAKPRDWKKIIIVTSDFHINRTKYLFGKVFGPGFFMDYHAVPTKLSSENLAYSLEMERKQLILSKQWLDLIVDGDDKAIAELLFSKHPGYAKNPEFSTEQLLAKLKSL